MESIEITGISEKVKDEELEDQIIEIYELADAKVHGKSLSKLATYCCVITFKIKEKQLLDLLIGYLLKILFVGKTIRADKRYKKIYINNSCSKEFSH